MAKRQTNKDYQEFLKTKETALQFAKTASRWDLFELFESACTMRLLQDDPCHAYSKMVRTGKVGLFDYGAGFLDFSIRYSPQGRPNTKEPAHFAQIYIGTLDDGELEAWQEFPTKEEAIQFVDKFAKEFLSGLNEFPTLEELNLEICKYGMWINYP